MGAGVFTFGTASFITRGFRTVGGGVLGHVDEAMDIARTASRGGCFTGETLVIVPDETEPAPEFVTTEADGRDWSWLAGAVLVAAVVTEAPRAASSRKKKKKKTKASSNRLKSVRNGDAMRLDEIPESCLDDALAMDAFDGLPSPVMGRQAIRFELLEDRAYSPVCDPARSMAPPVKPEFDSDSAEAQPSGWARRFAVFGLLSAVLFFAWRGTNDGATAAFKPTARASRLRPVDVSHSRTGVKLAGRRIDEMQVGQWVLAENPLGEKDLSIGEKVVPAEWRYLKLQAPKNDGGYAEVEMLRPVAWLKEQWTLKHLPPLETNVELDEETGEQTLALVKGSLWRVQNGELTLAPIVRPVPEFDEKLLVGEMLYVSVPECGIDGDAHVLQIGECPQISPRPGPEFQVVTATYHHHGANIVDVHVEGLSGAIGATPNHPFWSEDRQKFLRADELKLGERLRIADGGTRKVTAVTPRASTSDVFNLEVHLDHVYHVASNGVLVHNSVPCVLYHGTDIQSALQFLNGGMLDASAAAARKIDGPSGFFLATHLDDAKYFGARRQGTVLRFELSERAREILGGSGAISRPIPVGGPTNNFLGNEVFVNNAIFDQFNSLLRSGDIVIRPAR